MADFQGRLSPCLEEFEEEALDPRIQGELERLNRASEEINRLELELDDARASFRQALSDSTHKLDALAKKLGSAVEKARPYYDARHKSKEVHIETQKAAYMYERACSMHEAAKEMVQLAEQGYMQREDTSDAAWQEMLNHATMKVNDAEMERLESEKVHQRTMYKFKEAEDRVQKLQKDLKRAINKSRPYFEMKAKFNQMMEDRKKSVNNLEASVNGAKKSYSEALRNLEEISEEIHRQRLEMKNQAELGIRGAGVGSESPSPPPMRGKEPLSIDGKTSHMASSCSGGVSQTTVTTSQSSTVSLSSHNVDLPSVIYTSPEKARNRSYRQAIETEDMSDSRTERQILDSISEDFRVNLADDYMSLPSSSRRESMSKDQKFSDRAGDDLVFDDRHYELNPRRNSKSDSKVGDLTLTASSQVTPLSTVPSQHVKKSSKLKGLILLPVGAGQDPLQASLKINTNSNRPSSKILRQRSDQTAGKPPTYPYANNKVAQKVVSPTSYTYNKTEYTKDVQPDKNDEVAELPTPGSEKSVKRLLKVPSVQDFEEGSVSDTESITSGPMLDDDQLEFLTMDFTEQALEENDEGAAQNDWRMLSLPSNLSHLESYIRKYSETNQPIDNLNTENQEEIKENKETDDEKELVQQSQDD